MNLTEREKREAGWPQRAVVRIPLTEPGHVEGCYMEPLSAFYERMEELGWDMADRPPPKPDDDKVGFCHHEDGCRHLEAALRRGEELAERFGWA